MSWAPNHYYQQPGYDNYDNNTYRSPPVNYEQPNAPLPQFAGHLNQPRPTFYTSNSYPHNQHTNSTASQLQSNQQPELHHNQLAQQHLHSQYYSQLAQQQQYNQARPIQQQLQSQYNVFLQQIQQQNQQQIRNWAASGLPQTNLPTESPLVTKLPSWHHPFPLPTAASVTLQPPLPPPTPSWALPAPPPPPPPLETSHVPKSKVKELVDEKQLLLETTLYQQQQQLELALIQFDQQLVREFGLDGIIPKDLSEMRANLERRLHNLRDDYKQVWNDRQKKSQVNEIITLDESELPASTKHDGIKTQLASQVIRKFYFLEKQRQFVNLLDELDREFEMNGVGMDIVLDKDEYDEEDKELPVPRKLNSTTVEEVDDEETREIMAQKAKENQQQYVDNYVQQMQQIVASNSTGSSRPNSNYVPKTFDYAHGYRRGDNRFF